MNENTTAASGAAPATEPDTCDAEGNHIGVVAGFARHKYRQGTRACVAFVNGARWWHEVAALASPQVAPALTLEVLREILVKHDRSLPVACAEEILASAAMGAESEPVAFVNRDELDNMLNDRTATIQGQRSGWRKTALYLATPVQVAPPNLSSPLAGDCRTVGGFLSDVMTAAGLVEHGRQCKPLAERISVACSDLRARIFQGSAPVAPQDDARDAAEAIDAELPAYPTGDVIGPCVCGSWPGGPCLKCPAAKPTGEQS